MGNKEYVMLSMQDFIKLNLIAKAKQKSKASVIQVNDLIFLTDVMRELSENYDSELSIINDAITIKVCKDDGQEINSTFDLELCKKYYNKVNKFISEVL